MLRLLLCHLLIFLATMVVAQPYQFRHYQVESGLSNNTVFCIAQDRLGFMWLGTKEGLNRFDGYRFKKFSLQPGGQQALASDAVYSLHLAPSGTLWAGGQKGLFAYDVQTETFKKHLPDVNLANNIISTADGALWFLGNNRLYYYNTADKKAVAFAQELTGPPTSLCAGPKGSVWVGTADGWVKNILPAGAVAAAWNVFGADAKTARHIQKLHTAGDTGLFVGTSSHGIKLLHLQSGAVQHLLTYNSDKSALYVRDVIARGPDEYWFATESGIFIYHCGTKRFTQLKKKPFDPFSLPDNAVYTLYQDGGGGVWAGTYFGGAGYFSGTGYAFEKYFPADPATSIGGSVVRDICPDGSGNIWVGTEDAGLSKINGTTGKVTRFMPTGAPGSIAYNNIHGLVAAGNKLWIGTFEHGLDVMDIRLGKVVKHYNDGPGPYDLKSNFVVCLLQGSDSNIYLGTSTGLFVYNQQKDGFSRVPQTPTAFVGALIQGRGGNIWFAPHSGGVWYFNIRTGKKGLLRDTPDDSAKLSTNIVNALLEDSKGNLWMATEGGGLCMMDKQRTGFKRYTQKTGLPSNFVYKVLEDNSGTIWATTSKGLVNLRPDGIEVYTKGAGLLSDQFNYNSGYKDASGKLYFGSAKGMIAFRPEVYRRPLYQPPLYITGFQVQGRELHATAEGPLSQSILLTKELTLPYNQASFSIDYSALSFAAPDMTSYQYKMEGLEKNWTDLQQARRIYFTNLAPGSYTFRIRTGANNTFKPVEKSMAIHILPPWWATYWAYAFYIMAGAGLGLFLMRLYLQHIEDKKEKELYEAKLAFFTNVAHEIKTPLTLIKGPVENLQDQLAEVPQIKEDVDMLERNTRRLIALVTQILDFRKTETKGFSLEFTKVNMAALVREEWQAFAPLAAKQKLHCALYIPPTAVHAQADEEALRKILSNLFSNAVKYAEKEVQITLQPAQGENHSLLLQVASDGPLIPKDQRERIFEPFYRLRETGKHKGTGIGLALARSLTELHNGRLFLAEQSSGYNTFVLFIPAQPTGFPNTRKRPKKPLFQKQ